MLLYNKDKTHFINGAEAINNGKSKLGFHFGTCFTPSGLSFGCEYPYYAELWADAKFCVFCALERVNYSERVVPYIWFDYTRFDIPISEQQLDKLSHEIFECRMEELCFSDSYNIREVYRDKCMDDLLLPAMEISKLNQYKDAKIQWMQVTLPYLYQRGVVSQFYINPDFLPEFIRGQSYETR